MTAWTETSRDLGLYRATIALSMDRIDAKITMLGGNGIDVQFAYVGPVLSLDPDARSIAEMEADNRMRAMAATMIASMYSRAAFETSQGRPTVLELGPAAFYRGRVYVCEASIALVEAFFGIALAADYARLA